MQGNNISATYRPAKGEQRKFVTECVNPAIAQQLDVHNISSKRRFRTV